MNELQDLLIKEEELMKKHGINPAGISSVERFDPEEVRKRIAILEQISTVDYQMNKSIEEYNTKELSAEYKESIERYIDECKTWIAANKKLVMGNTMPVKNEEYNITSEKEVYSKGQFIDDKELNLPKYTQEEIREMLEERNALEGELGINHEDVVSDSARNGQAEDAYMLKYDILRLQAMKSYKASGNIAEEAQLEGTYTFYNDTYFADVENTNGYITKEEWACLEQKSLDTLDIDKRKKDSNGGVGKSIENTASREEIEY